MNRRGFLRAFSVATASGLLMPAQAERLIYELNKPVSINTSKMTDTEYLQMLLDNPIRGRVIIPPGEYHIDNTLMIRGNHLNITGHGSYIHQLESAGDRQMMYIEGEYNSVSHFHLTGNRKSYYKVKYDRDDYVIPIGAKTKQVPEGMRWWPR